ncbi:hypothetical protein CAPTEDRAFT_219281, partial [Capitella teleta]
MDFRQKQTPSSHFPTLLSDSERRPRTSSPTSSSPSSMSALMPIVALLVFALVCVDARPSSRNNEWMTTTMNEWMSPQISQNDLRMFDDLYRVAQAIDSERLQRRRKRPGGPGVLGLDNIDFAASTLDRARERPLQSIEGSSSNLPMSFGGSPSSRRPLPMRTSMPRPMRPA